MLVEFYYTIYGHYKGGAHLFTFFWSFACVESYSELVMIDISQWRASIGLWYYQICDNSIDKSVLSKKWTRAKHRKQLSNEVAEQDSNSETPAVQSNGQTPAVQCNGQTPAVLSNGWTPAVQSDGQTPAVQSNSSTTNTTMRYADWCGRVQTISLAVFLFLLLILSGDIELNPGPKTGK